MEDFNLDTFSGKKDDKKITDSIDILVSPVCHKDGKSYAFVSFSVPQTQKVAEGKIPDCSIISNNGMSEKEIQQITEYMQENLADLKKMAAGVDVFSAMMK